MSLELQFQSIIASFLFGLVLGFSYGFFNRVCFTVRYWPFRWFLEAVFDSAAVMLFFFLIVALNSGHFNLYLYLAVILGVCFYEKAFAVGYLCDLEYVMRFFRWFFSPFRFIFHVIRVILRKTRRMIRHGKKQKDQTE